MEVNRISSKKVYTLREIAEIYRVNYTTVMRWVHRGIIKPVSGVKVRLKAFRVGRKLFIKGQELRDFLRKCN